MAFQTRIAHASDADEKFAYPRRPGASASPVSGKKWKFAPTAPALLDEVPMTYPKDPVPTTIPATATWLGAAGVLPFLACGVTALYGGVGSELRADALQVMVLYGAVILSFLGGARWGLAMQHVGEETQARGFALSCIPALAAWGATFLSAGWALALLGVAFAVQGAWDAYDAGRFHIPKWYGALRVWLTLTVTGILALTLVAIGL